MKEITYRGRGGALQTRCVDSEGKFVACGRSRRGGMRGLRGYDSSWAMGFIDMDLPIVGRIDIPKTLSFNTTQGIIGLGLGKVAPGVIHGLVSRLFPSLAGFTKMAIGGLAGLTLLSPRYRRNSYLVGFSLMTVGDFLEPMLDSILTMVLGPPAASTQGRVRGMGALSQKEAEALQMAEASLLGQGIPGAGFSGRDLMLPSDYHKLTEPVSMIGSPGLRSIA